MITRMKTTFAITMLCSHCLRARYGRQCSREFAKRAVYNGRCKRSSPSVYVVFITTVINQVELSHLSERNYCAAPLGAVLPEQM